MSRGEGSPSVTPSVNVMTDAGESTPSSSTVSGGGSSISSLGSRYGNLYRFFLFTNHFAKDKEGNDQDDRLEEGRSRVEDLSLGGLVVVIVDDHPQHLLRPGGAALGEGDDPRVVGAQLETSDGRRVLADGRRHEEAARFAAAHAVRVAGEVVAVRRLQRLGQPTKAHAALLVRPGGHVLSGGRHVKE